MKKMMLCLLAMLLLVTSLCPAMAEENSADTLLMQELTEWAARYQARAIAAESLNDPKSSLTEDGYEFIYEFATFYADKPVMTADTAVSAIVLTADGEEGPRGTSVQDTAAVILSTFYQENDELRGNDEFAVLYMIDLLPESFQWGQVQRDGQRLETIQYAVHEQMTTGGEGYTDAGVIYTMQEGVVSAIRVYGLDSRITQAQVYEVLVSLRETALDTGYAQVPFSYDGTSLDKFGAEDLKFSGLDFASITPEKAVDVLGDPIDDLWEEDVDGYIRSMTFADCEIIFLYNAEKTEARVYMFLLSTDGMEGPRAVRLGDSFAGVFNRFRNGEGDFVGASREILYGSEASGEYGMAEYGDDASATLRYGMTTADGTRVVLHLYFGMGSLRLEEAMLYVAD